jgi:hypothetical protein
VPGVAIDDPEALAASTPREVDVAFKAAYNRLLQTVGPMQSGESCRRDAD